MSHGRHGDPIQHLNDDHADDLLAAARAFSGHADVTSARAEHVDREGIDLVLDTPRGPAAARIRFNRPVTGPAGKGLRPALVDLTRRARAALATDDDGSSAS